MSKTVQKKKLPPTQTDTQGKSALRAVWVLCGKFPIEEIAKGRRACRRGWRNRIFPEGPKNKMDMLSVTKDRTLDEGDFLILEREGPDFVDADSNKFSNIEDLMAEDWYLEK
jgi:hypothetical protein